MSGIIAAFVAVPAVAQDAELRPAPDYFVAAAAASANAQDLAQSCPSINVERSDIAELSDRIRRRLIKDGFDIERPDGGMIQIEERYEARKRAFRMKHGLDRDRTPERACAAGRSEITSGTSVGALLIEVGQ